MGQLRPEQVQTNTRVSFFQNQYITILYIIPSSNSQNYFTLFKFQYHSNIQQSLIFSSMFIPCSRVAHWSRLPEQSLWRTGPCPMSLWLHPVSSRQRGNLLFRVRGKVVDRGPPNVLGRGQVGLPGLQSLDGVFLKRRQKRNNSSVFSFQLKLGKQASDRVGQNKTGFSPWAMERQAGAWIRPSQIFTIF